MSRVDEQHIYAPNLEVWARREPSRMLTVFLQQEARNLHPSGSFEAQSLVKASFVGHEEWHCGKHQQHQVIDSTRYRVTLSEILGKRKASEP